MSPVFGSVDLRKLCLKEEDSPLLKWVNSSVREGFQGELWKDQRYLLDLNWLHSKRAGDIGIVDVNDLKGMAWRTTGMVDLATNLKAFSPKAAADLANALVSNTTLANALFTQYTPTEIGDIIGGSAKRPPLRPNKHLPHSWRSSAARTMFGPAPFSKEEKLELARTGIVVRDNRKEAAEAFVVKQEAVSSWAPPCKRNI